ncbi:MAG: M15 family metallopeptidase, partial [Firmicutes bacterium]|nr:M15 family metallopeptidase [Bacillota bacterium]
ITPFLLAFADKEGAPELLSPVDGAMLPDNSNIHIRVKYDGSDECFAEINSTVSSSIIKVENNELVILSSKLVRGREYHVRVHAGYKYSDVVSFRIGSRYEDEIARIIANTDIVAVRPRISKDKIFPNGFFHSEEEADANMATITVKVWRADTTDVEVDEEEVVDEIVRTISVPVTRYLKENTDENEDIEDELVNRSIHGKRSETADGDGTDDSNGEDTENNETAEPDDNADNINNNINNSINIVETPAEDDADTENGGAGKSSSENADTAESSGVEIGNNDGTNGDDISDGDTEENDKEKTDKENDVTEKDDDSEKVEVVEEYTEITTIEYITKTVRRSVKQGELYSSTMRITVNRALADTYTAIFNELYELKFPIESAGCYSWRDTASGRISEHALGTAIDINPDQNYCVYGDGSTVGSYWRPYEDIYSVTPEVVNIFRKYNFSWGGSWITPQDYMHFSYFGT